MFRLRISAYSDTITPSYPKELQDSLNELSDPDKLMLARKAVKELIEKGKENKRRK